MRRRRGRRAVAVALQPRPDPSSCAGASGGPTRRRRASCGEAVDGELTRSGIEPASIASGPATCRGAACTATPRRVAPRPPVRREHAVVVAPGRLQEPGGHDGDARTACAGDPLRCARLGSRCWRRVVRRHVADMNTASAPCWPAMRMRLDDRITAAMTSSPPRSCSCDPRSRRQSRRNAVRFGDLPVSVLVEHEERDRRSRHGRAPRAAQGGRGRRRSRLNRTTAQPSQRSRRTALAASEPHSALPLARATSRSGVDGDVVVGADQRLDGRQRATAGDDLAAALDRRRRRGQGCRGRGPT